MNQNTTVHLPLTSMLFFTFLVLKLTNVIQWSWWWVTSPIWIPFVAVFAIFFVLVVFMGLASFLMTW